MILGPWKSGNRFHSEMVWARDLGSIHSALSYLKQNKSRKDLIVKEKGVHKVRQDISNREKQLMSNLQRTLLKTLQFYRSS